MGFRTETSDFIDKRPDMPAPNNSPKPRNKDETNHVGFRTETEREGAEIQAGRHMPSAWRPQKRSDWLKPGPIGQTTTPRISRTFHESGKLWRMGEGRKEAKVAT